MTYAGEKGCLTQDARDTCRHIERPLVLTGTLICLAVALFAGILTVSRLAGAVAGVARLLLAVFLLLILVTWVRRTA
jgi:uncharacterized membrane protein YtjA (UPF0391 family)